MKKAWTAAVRSLFHHGGGTWATRLRYRKGVRILMYHRFPPASAFEEQCAHLKRYYRPVSLTEIGWLLQKRQEFPPGAVVLTVDDGYRDFAENAFPVLSEYSIPATVYLATNMMDDRTCLWVDWVRVLFRASPREELRLELPGKGPVTYRLSSQAEKDRAAADTKDWLKKVANGERLRFLDGLRGALGLQQCPPVPEEYAPLSWEEIREMAKKGVEFGAHTRSHPVLSRAGREEAREELAGSKARIEAELGTEVLHFCYPNGNPGDFTDETVELVQECGFLTAVTAERGANFAGADPLRLKRLHQEPWDAGLRFAQRVAGWGR